MGNDLFQTILMEEFPDEVHGDDHLVEVMESGHMEEAVCEFFLENYWNKQPKWVKLWTLEMFRENGEDILYKAAINSKK